MFHSGYVEKIEEKNANLKRKKQGKHKSIEKFPHVEGGEINKILCGQILNMGELICRWKKNVVLLLFFLGALFKFTIEKIVYSACPSVDII